MSIDNIERMLSHMDRCEAACIRINEDMVPDPNVGLLIEAVHHLRLAMRHVFMALQETSVTAQQERPEQA